MLDLLWQQRNILGVNARNLNYIKAANSKSAFLIADSKLKTKAVLKKAGVPVPQTFAKIKKADDLKQFDFSALPKSFVLKPNKGFGGEGIIVVYGREKHHPHKWIKADGEKIDSGDLQNHILNILEGSFSLYNSPDVAFFEERVKLLSEFKPYSFRGVPDIRILVYSNVPVMAELRVPTRESGGKSNLHLGGIGVGIDIGNGITTHAIYHGSYIECVPQSRVPFRGIKIPFWNEILRLAVKCQIVTPVKFLGVDIAIDREKGPLVLELNARPGLQIQLANKEGLRSRLGKIKDLEVVSLQKSLRIAKDLFGGEVEEEIEEISGKKIIGIIEKIQIEQPDGSFYETWAKIDTGAYRTAIDEDLSNKLGLLLPDAKTDVLNTKKVRGVLGREERSIVNIKFSLNEELIDTEAFLAERSDMKYDIIIGRKDLKNFLVDPEKNVYMGRKVKSKI